jgi:hypothetical protein
MVDEVAHEVAGCEDDVCNAPRLFREARIAGNPVTILSKCVSSV